MTESLPAGGQGAVGIELRAADSDLLALLQGPPGQIDFGSWLSSGEYDIRISFTLDTLGLSMTSLVALLSLLTLRFSVNYMHREDGFQRFFMILSLFMGAMLLIVMAGNAMLTFIAWELAGVSSYLLIAYAFDRPTATANATRALVTNRIGDAGFIIAIVLSLFWLGSTEWPDILACGSALDALKVGLMLSCFMLAALRIEGVGLPGSYSQGNGGIGEAIQRGIAE